MFLCEDERKEEWPGSDVRATNQKSSDADADADTEGPTSRADGLGSASAADALASGHAGKALRATTLSG